MNEIVEARLVLEEVRNTFIKTNSPNSKKWCRRCSRKHSGPCNLIKGEDGVYRNGPSGDNSAD